MKICTLSLLTLFLLFSTNLFSQDYFKLFQDYIPSEICKNETQKNDVNRTLELYGKLNPDLIYFYIMNLHLKLDKKIVNPDSNFTNILQNKFAKAKQLKRSWALTNIELINQNLSPKIKINRIVSIFEEYIASHYKEVIINSSLDYDKNKLEFFKYLYFTRNSALKYNTETDYSNLNNDVTKKLIENFNIKKENILMISKEQAYLLIDSALEFPYLFKGTYLSNYTQLTNYYLFEFIDSVVKEEYINSNDFSLQLSYNTLPASFDSKIEFTDPMDIKYSYKYSLKTKNSIFFNVGLKLKLNSEYKPFSFLNFKLGTIVYQSISSNLKDHIFFEGYKVIPGLQFTGKYYVNDFRNFNSYAISSNLSMPVYYLNKKVYVEAGISYYLQNIKFTYNFIREGDYTNPYGDDPDDFLKNEKINYSKNEHLVYPMIAINYFPNKNVNVRLEYLVPYQTSINFGYHFLF